MRRCLLLYCLFFYVGYSQAQLCTGSLSEPIISIDFGNGTSAYGSPLAAGETSYNYLATNNLQDGEYTITTTPSNGRPEWHNTQDHTDDNNGYMLLVNASYTAGEFYRTRVSGLCQNTVFEFSAWAMNVLPPNICNPSITPNLRFEIRATNGDLIAVNESGNITESATPQWINYGVTFNIGNNEEVDVIIINNASGGCGNDLAIDDIEFRACGDEANIISDLGAIQPFCSNNIPDEITLEATFNGNSYSTPFYQWENSTDASNWTPIANATVATLTVSPIVDGTYYRFRAAGSAANILNDYCSIVSNEIQLEIFDTPNFTINGATEICENEGLSLTIEPTNLIASVEWLLPDNSNSTGNPLVINNPQEGSYTAKVKDVNNCEWSLSHILSSVKDTSFTPVTIQECLNEVIQIGDNEDYTITQNEQVTRVIPKILNGCDSTIVYNITALPHYENIIDTAACYQSSIPSPTGGLLTLTQDVSLYYELQTKDGCDSLITKNITVPQPIDKTELACETDTVTLPDGTEITATATFSDTFRIPSLQYNCDSIINYTLNVGRGSQENIPIVTCPYQPVFLPDQSRVTQAGTYTRNFTSLNGCDSIINYIVTFDVNACSYDDLCVVRFPNAISPNNDGVNDTFAPLAAPICNYENYMLKIFNRWGEILFSTTNINEDWTPENDTNGPILWSMEYTLLLEDGTTRAMEDSGVLSILQ